MEIAIISGKGGTGKSSISAGFATLSEKVVLADCDVDAANLYLIFNPEHDYEEAFVGGQYAMIDYDTCTNCGICLNYCRFEAINEITGRVVISETTCDGCRLCSRICPVKAITMIDNDKSRMYSGRFRNGEMVYGRLAPGEENSGKLVNMVRQKAKELSKTNSISTIIIDGPPGIGCPVISTITGVDHVVIVTEPTISGLNDLKRTLEVSLKFNLKSWVIINKYDLNAKMAEQIELYCNGLGIEVIGKLPFYPKVVEAMVHCKSIVEFDPGSDFSNKIHSAYQCILNGNL
jgi:MinD superfamily P-loop ATPase